MLHIILAILKFIGILLLVLLGLLLFLIAAAVFYPFTYRISGKKNAEVVQLNGRVIWLLGALYARVQLVNGKPDIRVRILGYMIYPRKKKAGKTKKIKEKSAKKVKATNKNEIVDRTEAVEKQNADQTKVVKKQNSDQTNAVEEQNSDQTEAAEKQISDRTQAVEVKRPNQTKAIEVTISDGTEAADNKRADIAGGIDKQIWSDPEDVQEGASEKTKPCEDQSIDEPSFLERTWERLTAFFRNLLSRIKNIGEKFKNIWNRICKTAGSIKNAYQTAGNFIVFLQMDETKSTLGLLWEQIKVLLKHIAPAKIKGEIHFGTDDPALTGQILGGAAVVSSFIPHQIRILPDFEQEILEGEVEIKGYIQLFCFIKIAWKIYRDKNVKRTWKRFNRGFKNKEA